MPDVNYIDWHVHPFRADRWLEAWRPALDRGQRTDRHPGRVPSPPRDPDHADFERYWYSEEIAALREEALNYYNKPLLPTWHTTTFDASPLPAVD